MVVRMLSARGHAIESASNGSAGLKRLTDVLGSALDFDCVLCDFQMPVLCSGFCKHTALLLPRNPLCTVF